MVSTTQHLKFKIQNILMITLGIESSCDDTAVAIIDDRKLLAHKVSSQLDLHRPYGGVVPELAARSHVEIIDLLIGETLKEAGLEVSDIELISATGGPGLIGGVITSVMVAKGLSLANNTPLVFVNHLEGHSLMARFEVSDLDFPFLLFLASGGHCQILECASPGSYKKYGSTLDDAIGEAFDKTAKLLGLPYPGGPAIEQVANQGDPDKYNLPISMKGQSNCDFSLSGLKTAVRHLCTELAPLTDQKISDISASFQNAVAAQICDRLETAFKKYTKEQPNAKRQLVFSGGVAANKFIRSKIEISCQKHDFKLICPSPKYCTDNGIMIAWAGLENYKIGKSSNLDFTPKARWPLDLVVPN